MRLKNIYSCCDYKLGKTSRDNLSPDSIETYEQNITIPVYVAGTYIVREDSTFMMIPQTMSNNAAIEIDYTDSLSNTQRKLTATIRGSSNSWEMGKTYTYKILLNSIVSDAVLTVTGNDNDSLFLNVAEGTRGQYHVASYIRITCEGDTTKKVPVPWKAGFSSVRGGTTFTDTQPDWLTTFTTENSTGDATATAYDLAVSERGSVPLDDALKQGSSVNDCDLSTYEGDSLMNTANCYIVNAPGTY